MASSTRCGRRHSRRSDGICSPRDVVARYGRSSAPSPGGRHGRSDERVGPLLVCYEKPVTGSYRLALSVFAIRGTPPLLEYMGDPTTPDGRISSVVTKSRIAPSTLAPPPSFLGALPRSSGLWIGILRCIGDLPIYGDLV